MVLIAIDKHSRKILGYLCKNDEIVAYCCSECEEEFTASIDLENHMVKHEQRRCHRTSVDNELVAGAESVTNTFDTDSSSDGEIPMKVLCDKEIEGLLRIKYQVTPCSIILHRFDEDDEKEEEEEEADKTESTSEQVAEMQLTDHENTVAMDVVQSGEPIIPPELVAHAHPTNPIESTEAVDKDQLIESIDAISTVENLTLASNIAESINLPPVNLTESVRLVESNVPVSPSIPSSVSPLKPRGRPPKKRTQSDAIVAVSIAPIGQKRLKIPTQKSLANAQKNAAIKRAIKSKPIPPPAPSVCFLCGRQFSTLFQLTQHEKTHLSRSESPVFPCNICHQNVKNLKMHLREHKKDAGKNVGSKFNKSTKTAVAAKSTVSMKLNGSSKLGATSAKSTREKFADNSKVTKEEASSSTDAVVSSNKNADIITSNEAQTNSTDSNGSFISNGKLSETDSSSTKIISKSVFIPPTIVDEYPANVHKISIIEPIGVNEPSQSTETSNESAEQSESEENANDKNDTTDERNEIPQPGDQQSIDGLKKCFKCSRRFSTDARLNKHQKKHGRKKNCKICGKLLALSYVKMHIKLKHPTPIDIPLRLNIQALNIQDEAP